jgi:hypothetical protein
MMQNESKWHHLAKATVAFASIHPKKGAASSPSYQKTNYPNVPFMSKNIMYIYIL